MEARADEGRIESLDVLRGLAILGILVINIDHPHQPVGTDVSLAGQAVVRIIAAEA